MYFRLSVSSQVIGCEDTSEMTEIVSDGVLNSSPSQTPSVCVCCEQKADESELMKFDMAQLKQHIVRLLKYDSH